MISFTSHSGIHTLRAVQDLPLSREQAWEFLSDPRNLSAITPENMRFAITSEPEPRMYAGQIITYRVSPLPGLRLNWTTEISHVQEGAYFVDEQRFGPYALWHHKHFLEDLPGGIRMVDQVDYRLPLGPLGRLANWLFVRERLRGIFGYRYKVLERRFGRMPVDAA